MLLSVSEHAKRENLKRPFTILGLAEKRNYSGSNISLRQVLSINNPKITLTASKTGINYGEKISLSWTALSVDRVELIGFSGQEKKVILKLNSSNNENSLEDVTEVFPSELSNNRRAVGYQLIAYGPGGRSRKQVTIRFTDTPLPPQLPTSPKRTGLNPILSLRRQRIDNILVFAIFNLNKLSLAWRIGLTNLDEINEISSVKNPNSYAVVLRHVDEHGDFKEVLLPAFTTTNIFNGRRIFGNWIANTDSLFTENGQQRTTIPISIMMTSV